MQFSKRYQFQSQFNGELMLTINVFGSWSLHRTKSESLSFEQSGSYFEGVWKNLFKRVASYKPNVNSALLIGVGAGCALYQLRKRWQNIPITGLEIDEAMVDIAKMIYGEDFSTFDLHRVDRGRNEKITKLSNVSVQIGNAADLVNHLDRKYHLIIVDLLLDFKSLADIAGSPLFISKCEELLAPKGLLVVNIPFGSHKSIDAWKAAFPNHSFWIVPSRTILFGAANRFFISS